MAPPPTLGWIWPKDPRPGNPSRWPRRWRLLDILTNKGPDIYVGVIGKTSSTTKSRSKTNWGRWEGDLDEEHTPIPWARRDTSVRYDFRRRRYQVPDQGTWSGVEYCDGRRTGGWFGREERHCVPRRYWDRNGDEYPANQWHDIVYGVHEDRGW